MVQLLPLILAMSDMAVCRERGEIPRGAYESKASKCRRRTEDDERARQRRIQKRRNRKGYA